MMSLNLLFLLLHLARQDGVPALSPQSKLPVPASSTPNETGRESNDTWAGPGLPLVSYKDSGNYSLMLPVGRPTPCFTPCCLKLYFRNMYSGFCFGKRIAGKEWWEAEDRQRMGELCGDEGRAHQRQEYSLAFPRLLQSDVAAAGWLEGPCTNPNAIPEIHRRRRLAFLDRLLSLRENSIYYKKGPIRAVVHSEQAVAALGFLSFAIVRAVIWANPTETTGFFYTFLQWDSLLTATPALFRALREYAFNNVPRSYKPFRGGGCTYTPFLPFYIMKVGFMLFPSYAFWWTNTLSLLDRCCALGCPVWYHKVMSGNPTTRFRRLVMPLFLAGLFYAWNLAPGPNILGPSFPFTCRHRLVANRTTLETCCDFRGTHLYTHWLVKLVFLGFLPELWRRRLCSTVYLLMSNPFTVQGLLWLTLLILLLRLRRKHKTAGVAAMENKDKAALRMTIVLAQVDLLVQLLLYINNTLHHNQLYMMMARTSVRGNKWGFGSLIPKRLLEETDMAVVDAGLTRYALCKDLQIITNILLVIMTVLGWAILPVVSGTYRRLLLATCRKLGKRLLAAVRGPVPN